MKRINWFWPYIILYSTLAAGIVSFTLPGTVLCLIVIVWFLLICPGMTMVHYLNLKDGVAELTVAIALSLTIDAIVASIALYAGAWSPVGILYTLIIICTIGVIGQFLFKRSGPIAIK